MGYLGFGVLVRGSPLVHLIVALQCEAMPLIEYFGLKRRMAEHSFPVYENGSFSLTVSGVGKVASAAAVAYTQVLFGSCADSVWLNVGIAGHRDYAAGGIYAAHKICDQDNGQRWYPPLTGQLPCASAAVSTVARPQARCLGDCLYDMEAAGFYSTATRFSTAELVQCLKIVSDNGLNVQKQINPKQVAALISSNLATIAHVYDSLHKMAQSIFAKPPVYFPEFLDRWRFTVSQQRQLESLLNQWEIVSPHAPPAFDDTKGLNSGREVLMWLKDNIDALPVA